MAVEFCKDSAIIVNYLQSVCVCRYVGVDIIFGHINESPVSDTDLVGRSLSTPVQF